MIGKYERGDASPSIEAAKKIADALGVTLDFLTGEQALMAFDKRTLQRIQDIEKLDEDTKNMLFNLVDTVIRDAKAKGVYSA